MALINFNLFCSYLKHFYLRRHFADVQNTLQCTFFILIKEEYRTRVLGILPQTKETGNTYLINKLWKRTKNTGREVGGGTRILWQRWCTSSFQYFSLTKYTTCLQMLFTLLSYLRSQKLGSKKCSRVGGQIQFSWKIQNDQTNAGTWKKYLMFKWLIFPMYHEFINHSQDLKSKLPKVVDY